ncbi:hypothetical protein GYMLUDRAFT_47123 [Collybiopsis luxurians FD-317 M1]|uniref:Unplaced genomic scaffold GYMLUscaffold_50, whole genome shotgun sequence n=1 Tax=Collybiopsis luxurians FD-317 M1 TaxID=944289 RepID=A0A0D0CE65_9AGAR|nr:hypothetical protein GYMLUDRAFT_47123 [Collybiopsis luxurians FD-317 M1]
MIPTSIVQPCPTCRSLYSIAHVDSELLPTSVRAHLFPSIRKLYLEEPNSDTKSPSSSSLSAPSSSLPRLSQSEVVSECGRLSAENQTLRMNCAVWQKRAEIHAAATLGLMNLARMAKAYSTQLKLEKEDLQRQCNLLKRKLEVEESFASFAPVVPSSKIAKSAPDALPHPSSRHGETLRTSGTTQQQPRASSAQNTHSKSIQLIPAVPPERDLPPSLKRRKTDSCAPGLLACGSEENQSHSPRRSLRKRKELMS